MGSQLAQLGSSAARNIDRSGGAGRGGIGSTTRLQWLDFHYSECDDEVGVFEALALVPSRFMVVVRTSDESEPAWMTKVLRENA